MPITTGKMEGMICLRQNSQAWFATLLKRVKLTDMLTYLYYHMLRSGEDVKSNTGGRF